MSKWYTRSERRAYKEKRQAQAKIIANMLLGKKTETLFQPGDEWKWTALKGRQIGLSMYNNLLVKNPRSSIVISGMEGV